MIRFHQTAPADPEQLAALSEQLSAGGSSLEIEAANLSLAANGLSHASLDGNRLTLGWGDVREASIHGRALMVSIDLAEVQATLRTDRFATIPACYAEQCDGGIHIASRADQIGVADTTELDPQAIYNYLYFHVIPAPDTIFVGVRRAPPASEVVLHKGSAPTVQAWWTPRFEPMRARDANLGELKREFMGIVQRGVEQESKGNFGAFLSGGTDSSTLTGMLSRVHGSVRCYSMGFEAEGYDEMDYARTAARHFGADHREHYVTPVELTEHIPAVAAHYDQPFGNSSALPSYVLARLAREEGIDHLLAGDGGDELFGGNTRYAKQKIFGYYDRIPPALRSQLIEPLLESGLGRLPVARKAASYMRQARTPLPDRNEGYNLILRLGPDKILDPAFLAAIDTSGPLELQRSVWNAADAEDDLNRALAFDWRFTLADNDLPKILGTAELAGIGIGFPLLSDELLDFSLRLPIDYKLKGYKLRWFFKEALRGFLPERILSKKKHGFGLPFGAWAMNHDGLREVTRDALRGFAQRKVLNPAFLDELETKLLPAYPGYYGEMVWIIVMLELWLRAKRPDWSLA